MTEELIVPDRLGVTLDGYWAVMNSEPLRRVAARWLGDGKGTKDQRLQALVRGTQDPQFWESMRSGLSPFEQSALTLLKLNGGWMAAAQYAPALLASGHPYAANAGSSAFSSYGYGTGSARYAALNALENQGLVGAVNVPRPEASPGAQYYDYRDLILAAFTDARLLDGLRPEPPRPLTLTPVTVGGGGRSRRPAEVSLRLITLIDALFAAGSIPLTTRGRPSRTFINKIGKGLGWEKSLDSDPHTPLADPIQFYYQLLVSMAAVVRDEDTAFVGDNAARIAYLPYQIQGRLWWLGYTSLTGWMERELNLWLSQEDLFYVTPLNGIRAVLLMGLAALPDPQAWYGMEDLSRALFDRVGQHFALGTVPHFYEPYRSTPAQKEEARKKWQQETRVAWDRSEGPWIHSALVGPLYHLGLVEVGWQGEAHSGPPDAFRLTDLGQAAVYGAFRPEFPVPAALQSNADLSEPAWIVQPNFDVIAYLDRLSPGNLHFLARIGQRKPSDGAVSIYQLTRESIYRALQDGMPLDGLIQTLEAGSRQPLSPVVRRALEDWAAKRERVTVYQNAEILEYPSTAARDAALASVFGLGIPVGERFVLLAPDAPRDSLRKAAVVDYLQPPVKCLTLHEDGRIELDATRADFLVRGELGHWADPEPGSAATWRITASSIRRATQGGWEADQILRALEKRSQGSLPPLLRVAVRAWGRKRQSRPQAGLAKEVVLQLAADDAAEAVAGSELFRPLLRARLGPRTFLVHATQSKALDRLLTEYGLQPIADLAPFGEGDTS